MEMVTRATNEKADWDTEYRIVLENGKLKHIHAVAHAVTNGAGVVEYIGTVMDVTERKRAESAARGTVGSRTHQPRDHHGRIDCILAHEINQPLAAAVTNANTTLRWLTREHPDLEEVRASALES